MLNRDQGIRSNGALDNSGQNSREKAQLVKHFEIAIIAPQMTGKTLVHTSRRPLLYPSFLMALGLVSLLLVSAPAGAELLEVADVIAHPQHYDRKGVVVMGQVTSGGFGSSRAPR